MSHRGPKSRRVALLAMLTAAALLVPTSTSAKPVDDAQQSRYANAAIQDFPIPEGLRMVSSTGNTMRVRWDEVEGAPRYRVVYSTDPSMENAKRRHITNRAITLKNLQPDTTYYLRVGVVDPETNQKLSPFTRVPYPTGQTQATPDMPFATPTDVGAAAVSANAAHVTWEPVDGVDSYRVQRSTSAKMTDAVVQDYDEPQAVMTGLAAQTRYFLRVAAIDPATGEVGSFYSPRPYPRFRTNTRQYLFSIPTGLEAAEVDTTSVGLEWDAVPGAPMYRVQLSSSPSMAGATYHRFTDPSGTIGDLDDDTTYYARVAVIDPDSGAKLSDYTAQPYTTFTTEGTGGSDEDVELPVATFNVYGVNNDSKAGGDQLTWAGRRSAVIDRIIDSDAAVVGLQEANQSSIYGDDLPVGPNQFLDLLAGLQAEDSAWALTNSFYYNCERHTSSNNCDYVDRGASLATRIAYDSSRVELLEQGSVEYDAQTGSTHRFMPWAKFRLLENGREFFFATTHLQPGGGTSESVRRQQWSQLADEVDERAGNLPAIVVGDFNGSKFSTVGQDGLTEMRGIGVSDVLSQRNSTNPPTNIRAEQRTHAFVNSYNNFSRNIKPHSYWDAQHKIGNGIDYIFASDSLRVTKFQVHARYSSSTWQQTGVLPSDHYLLSASIVLPAP